MPGRAWELVGPIVRRAALPPADAGACRSRLGLDPDRPTLFVSGGSQGARSINTLMSALARTNALAGWQVVHQTGRDADPELASAYAAVGVRASVVEFIDEVGLAWGAADLALGRAGAGTVAEAWATRTPTVFLPYPYHADEHQRRNAEPLASAGGALVLTDRIDAAANLADHAPVLADLLASADRRARMRTALEALGPADGADRVAERLLASLA
ncbi:MAG: UDP-N-acetylglucosamine--N-acetylmuramyl-(pentapeptide) pyrophosphoryl-undecaprenol N-acetylglucosamine transferase [Phycisphaerales bacterium]